MRDESSGVWRHLKLEDDSAYYEISYKYRAAYSYKRGKIIDTHNQFVTFGFFNIA